MIFIPLSMILYIGGVSIFERFSGRHLWLIGRLTYLFCFGTFHLLFHLGSLQQRWILQIFFLYVPMQHIRVNNEMSFWFLFSLPADIHNRIPSMLHLNILPSLLHRCRWQFSIQDLVITSITFCTIYDWMRCLPKEY